LSGFLISRSSPIYSATKAACMMLAVGLREELKDSGVQVTSTFPGFIDTDMTTSMAIEKASPRSVAERSLDGLSAGATSVFPDRFAEMVREALEHDMGSVLTEPQQVATRVVRDYRQSTASVA
jgi:short-subunit dehydrogenase